MRLLIIIPAHNEAENIERVVSELVHECPQFDFVVVNDGSSDETGEVCKKNGYKLLELPVNLGLSYALQTGLRYAFEQGYDCAMQFDADGQHVPKYIPAMFDEVRAGSDIVIGSRFVNIKKPKSLRMLGSYLISWTIRLTTGKRICDPTSGMRVYSREMIREFAYNLNYAPEPDTISYLIKNGAKIKELQVDMRERQSGESYLRFGNSVTYMAKMICSILLIQWFRKREDRELIEKSEVSQ